jgi:hypothetical protein
VVLWLCFVAFQAGLCKKLQVICNAGLRVLLSPGARRKMKKIGFPLPGALLLHGPPVSWVQPYQCIGSGTPSISGCLSLCNWCS